MMQHLSSIRLMLTMHTLFLVVEKSKSMHFDMQTIDKSSNELVVYIETKSIQKYLMQF
jgi:hypothetical protein